MGWVVILLFFGYGLFYVGWPQKARQQYLAHFDVDAPTKWYKPNTFLTFRPPAVVFRVVGVVLLAIAIFLIYIENSQYTAEMAEQALSVSMTSRSHPGYFGL